MSPQRHHRPSNSMAGSVASRANARSLSCASPIVGLWLTEQLAQFASQQLAHFVVGQLLEEHGAFRHARRAQAIPDELLQFGLAGWNLARPGDDGDTDSPRPIPMRARRMRRRPRSPDASAARPRSRPARCSHRRARSRRQPGPSGASSPPSRASPHRASGTSLPHRGHCARDIRRTPARRARRSRRARRVAACGRLVANLDLHRGQRTTDRAEAGADEGIGRAMRGAMLLGTQQRDRRAGLGQAVGVGETGMRK